MLGKNYGQSQIFIEFSQRTEKICGSYGIELARRLIKDQHIRPHDGDRREVYQLLLPAGELRDVFFKKLCKAKIACHLGYGKAHFLLPPAKTFGTEGKLVKHLICNYLIVRVLKDKAYAPCLLAMKAADYRDEGLNMNALIEHLASDRSGLCEYFTVDDLMHLRRGGRLSGIAAMVGTVLNVKPLLRGDEEGKIVVFSKLRGRKKAIEAIAHEYEAKSVDPQNQRVAISHGDCPEDAEKLAELVREIAEPKELIIAMHEPYTGIHVGPGMLSLFFLGAGR